jgi:transcriptional regulator with XRE-family HTH domain
MTFYFLFIETKNQIMNKSVGEKLKELRKANGFSLEDILQKLQISESTYLRMVKGEASTWTTKIDYICKLYTIKTEKLLLSDDKYSLISNNQKGGSASNITINHDSEKAYELYERLLIIKEGKKKY